MRRIILLVYNIFAAVINLKGFENFRFDYVKYEQKEISTDVGYILSVITKIISKWLKHDIRREFNKYIPPPSEIDLNIESKVLNYFGRDWNWIEIGNKFFFRWFVFFFFLRLIIKILRSLKYL